MVIHCDGKMVQDLVGRDKIDRIAILVSYNGTSKFLGAPKVHPATGENIANVVYETIIKWKLEKHIKGISFDTTSVNTGVDNGVIAVLNRKLGIDLVNMACRHHVYEISLHGTFQTKFGSSSAPEVPLFERFAKSWSQLNHDTFKSGIEDEFVCLEVNSTERENIKTFCGEQLKKKQIRDDYKEFLELALIFLGEKKFDEKKLGFRLPGPTSHARWMAKAIYTFSQKYFYFVNSSHFQTNKNHHYAKCASF